MSARNGWQRVKFGDVVRNVSESVADPVSAGLERAVGLEHLEPGELEVTRWASTGDGLTFTRRFSAGQVLFGRRRAYQRKVAITDFDGVCSGDIYVFEPSGERLTAHLLPFIVQSEPFFQYALRTSAGSLSPRTKWTDLKNYEFELPPVDEQREIADLLWSAERVCRCERALVRSARGAASCAVEAAVQDGWREVALGDVLDRCQYGLSLATSESGSIPIVGMNEVSRGGVHVGDVKRVDLSPAQLQQFRLQDRDVLLNRTNSVDHVGRTGIYRGEGDVVFASYLIRLRPRNELQPEYLNLFLNSRLGRGRVRARMTKAVSQANINAESIKAITIPLPPPDMQEEIVRYAKFYADAQVTAERQVADADVLRRALVHLSRDRRTGKRGGGLGGGGVGVLPIPISARG